MLCIRQIAWWMLDLYFGLDATGFDKSSVSSSFRRDIVQTTEIFYPAAQFHEYLGPIMMVTYACLSNTLLLTGTLALNLTSELTLVLVQSWFL